MLEQTIWNPDSRLDGKSSGLVETTQQFLGYDPLEILFAALDPIPGTPVRLHGQQSENGIDMTRLDSVATLRPLVLVVDVVVDMIDVCHVRSRL
jgi:hypothetical protein